MIKNFLKKDYFNGCRIVIYGAGLYGEIVFWALETQGMEPAFFADINDGLNEKNGIKVIRPEEICAIPDPIVILASSNGLGAMLEKTKELGISNVYGAYELLCAELGEYESNLSEHAKDLYTDRGKKYLFNLNNIDTELCIVKNIDLVLTERCNLRCRDCGSLMRYYKKPCHLSTNEIIEPFDRFLQTIDVLYELRLLGGETFLFPHLDEIITRYGKTEKIKHITLFTNSTIVPSNELLQVIKEYNADIHMSNYGQISSKVDQISERCETMGIPHYVHDYHEWRDMGGLSRRDYSFETIGRIIRTCDNVNCPSFFRGRLYVCPRAAHGERVGAFQNLENEYVDFRSAEQIQKKQEEIKAFFKKRDYFTACMYCNGNSTHAKPIEAALQIKSNAGR